MKSLYIDSSSLIRIATGDHNGPELKGRAYHLRTEGYRWVSSQLLELECRRTAIRLAQEGQGDTLLDEWVAEFDLLPISDTVWRKAMEIEQHVKTLDALHLATASLVPDCLLLTSDKNMQSVATALGIQLA